MDVVAQDFLPVYKFSHNSFLYTDCSLIVSTIYYTLSNVD